uniref:Aldo-keto reductase n=1 Tax=Papilio xuthus TaxID=66420 RepID=I4DKQ3_PAPXU|nr:uncharacterized protein LOC106124434 precursor [Papilio xuthus]BAM18493.1 aldo-keto reductase [Papilio xuthus]
MFVYKLFIFILTISATVASPSGPIQTFKLNDGRDMPGFGLGTWLGFISTSGNSKSQEVENAVKWAIDAGYRHIDTASIYDTEDQVGNAINKKIAEDVVKREDIFVTTKLWNDAHGRYSVLPALKNSLKKLNLDYVDMYLMHWPIAQYLNGTFYDVDYLETWEAMIAVQKKGLAKSIGVSNFNKAMLERLISNSSVKPANLQVELNLNLQQPELLEYCKEQNIVVTGYTPFGSIFPNKARSEAPPPRVDDPKLVDIAKKYNKTVPQIVLRYLVELNIIPIPKTITKSRVEQNIDIFDFKLTQEERDLFKSYDTNYRTIEPKMWQESPYYPFEMK